jgi:hypothetical protein
MFENESFFWLLGAVLGGVMASLMAVRAHRWLNRPLVVVFAMLLGAWVAALAARSSTSVGSMILLRSAAAAWCYPWICLTLLDVYRRTWISARVFPIEKIASIGSIVIAPLFLVAISVASYLGKMDSTARAVSMVLVSAFGVSLGYLVIQMALLARPNAASAERQRVFRRSVFYPTINGGQIRPSRGLPFKRAPVASAVTSSDAAPISEQFYNPLDIGMGVDFSMSDPNQEMTDDLGLGEYPDE